MSSSEASGTTTRASIALSPAIESATAGSFFPGFRITTTTQGVDIDHYSISPKLSNGNLSFDSKYGYISGVPSIGTPARSYTITAYSHSGVVLAKAKYILTIKPNPVGWVGPGGGTVFYYSSTPFAEVGAKCGSNCHYLEWAPNTWSGGTSDPKLAWSSDPNNETDAIGTAIGSGFSNTQIMLTSGKYYQKDISGAAYAVSNFAASDQSTGQWFLPSKNELDAMWKYQSHVDTVSLYKNVSSFTPFYNYWSSTEDSSVTGCTYVNFVCDPTIPTRLYAFDEGLVNTDGLQSSSAKSDIEEFVRPIRAF